MSQGVFYLLPDDSVPFLAGVPAWVDEEVECWRKQLFPRKQRALALEEIYASGVIFGLPLDNGLVVRWDTLRRNAYVEVELYDQVEELCRWMRIVPSLLGVTRYVARMSTRLRLEPLIFNGCEGVYGKLPGPISRVTGEHVEGRDTKVVIETWGTDVSDLVDHFLDVRGGKARRRGIWRDGWRPFSVEEYAWPLSEMALVS